MDRSLNKNMKLKSKEGIHSLLSALRILKRKMTPFREALDK